MQLPPEKDRVPEHIDKFFVIPEGISL